MSLIEFAPNNHHSAKIVCDEDSLELFREAFSVANPAKRAFGNRFAGARIPSRLYAITETGTIQIGFIPVAIQLLKKKYPSWQFKIDPKVMASIRPSLEHIEPVLAFGAKVLREYQQVGIVNALKFGRGVIEHPTAAGKTILLASIVASTLPLANGTPHVVIVPDPGLAKQTADDLRGFGIGRVNLWTGKNALDTNCDVIVAAHKIMYLNVPMVKDLLKDSPVVIVDECHSIQHGNKINEVIKAFQTPNKFGLTGTLPDSSISQWNVFGRIGPIIAKETSTKLVDQGFIAPVEVICIHVDYKAQKSDFDAWCSNSQMTYQDEVAWLVNNQERSKLIAQIAGGTPKNTLVLLDRLQSAHLVSERLNAASKPNALIVGSTVVSEREDIQKMLEEGTDKVLVAMMQIFRQGINVSNIHYIIMGSLGKARTRFIQAAGRGRRQHADKQKLVIFDIVDGLPFSQRHGQQRQAIFEKEGFKVSHKNISI